VNSETLTSLAEALRQSGDLDESLTLFTRVPSDYPQCRSACAEAAVGLAKIYQKKGENLRAIEHYLNVLVQYPERYTRTELARGRIGELMPATTDVSPDLQSRIAKASDMCDKAREEDRNIKTAISTARAGKSAKADLLTLFANPAVQSSYGRLILLGDSQLAVGDKANARTTYEKYLAVAASELDPEGYKLTRIKTYYKLGDYVTVVSQAREAVNVYAEGASAMEFHYYLALGMRH